jgi:hypothetical protein
MGGILKFKHLAASPQCTDVKNGVASVLRSSVIRSMQLGGAPMRVDFGVFAVLMDVVVETLSAGRVGGDDEVGAVRTKVGEDDRRLIVALEQFEHVDCEHLIEIGSPDRSVA